DEARGELTEWYSEQLEYHRELDLQLRDADAEFALAVAGWQATRITGPHDRATVGTLLNTFRATVTRSFEQILGGLKTGSLTGAGLDLAWRNWQAAFDSLVAALPDQIVVAIMVGDAVQRLREVISDHLEAIDPAQVPAPDQLSW